MSLAVAFNLTLAFPALVLALLFLWVARPAAPALATPAKPVKGRKKDRRTPKRAAAPPGLFVWFVLPALGLVLLLFLATPLGRAYHFYYGVGSLRASLENLVGVSLAHKPGPANIDWEAAWLALWRRAVTVLAPVMVALSFGVALLAMRRYRRGGAPPDRVEVMLLLASGTTVGSVLLLVGSHYGLGFPYPSDRTGLYFLPLAALCLAGLGRAPAGWRRPGILTYAHLVLLLGLAVQYALQWNTTHFHVWRYDADSKTIFRRIAQDSRDKKPPVRVGMSWFCAPSLGYYRALNNWKRFPPFDASGPEDDFDYYVLGAADRALVARRGVREIYRGPVSGMVLAVPAGR